VKAHALISDALSDWRKVRNAPDLAHDLFDDLDDDERDRLAMRGFTDEIRATLRRKDKNGVPVYSSVLTPALDGTEPERIYKQTALFDVADYEVAVRSYREAARVNNKIARALVEDCLRRLGVQLVIEGLAS
jgi:hypothetical protein